ncbi:hypothetical protein Tco_1165699 [Tanacetum coccineum]
MLEMRRHIRSEKECLEVRRNVRSKKTIKSEMTIRSEKTIKKERNRLEVKRPFEMRKDVYVMQYQTKLSVLYLAIPFQTQGMKQRQLQYVVVFLTMDLQFHRPGGGKGKEVTKDTELPSTEDIQPPPLIMNKPKTKKQMRENLLSFNKAKT